jgi:hypothetical protein
VFAQLVQALPKADTPLQADGVFGVLEADVGDLEFRIVGVAVDGERLAGRPR